MTRYWLTTVAVVVLLAAVVGWLLGFAAVVLTAALVSGALWAVDGSGREPHGQAKR